jgi:hypothetical protein
LGVLEEVLFFLLSHQLVAVVAVVDLVDQAVEENTALVVLGILPQQVRPKEIQEVVCVLEVLIHILPEVVVAVAVLVLVVVVVVLEEMVVMVRQVQ